MKKTYLKFAEVCRDGDGSADEMATRASETILSLNDRETNVVLTFGTFDVFHIGHLRILQRAAEHGVKLIVGVSSDALNIAKKGRSPIYSQEHRMAIISALGCVDSVFLEESLEEKRNYLLEYQADVLVMGDDWEGRFDDLSDVCKVVYLPRTPAISTTKIIEVAGARRQ